MRIHSNKRTSEVGVVSRDSIHAHELVQNIDYANNGANTLNNCTSDVGVVSTNSIRAHELVQNIGYAKEWCQ